MMKVSVLTGWLLLGAVAGAAAEVPEVFRGLLVEDELVKAELVVVIPPEEIDKYVAKVEEAAGKDPEWFAKYSKDAAPGVPLPFHENLGLTREEYAEYLDLWSKREFRPVAQVVLQLKQPKKGEWTITGTGQAGVISTLRYLAEKDVFASPNGTLERIEDIDASEQSILGKWSGREWRMLEETSLGKTKENMAVGRTGDGTRGLLVYRVQEISSQGTRLYDKSLVVRFPITAGTKK